MSYFNYFIKIYGQIESLTHPSFIKYSLRLLYHMHPDCFNSYKDLYTFIEYKLRCDD